MIVCEIIVLLLGNFRRSYSINETMIPISLHNANNIGNMERVKDFITFGN